jgi:hypothetical protein
MYTMSPRNVIENRLHLNRLGEYLRYFEPSGSVISNINVPVMVAAYHSSPRLLLDRRVLVDHDAAGC